MRFRCHLVVLLLATVGNGCALFQMDLANEPKEQSREVRKVARRTSDRDFPVKRVVRMTSNLIVQPAREKRVREQVWNEMCEIVFREPQVRRRLNENGVRVGVAAPPCPLALTRFGRESMRLTVTAGDDQLRMRQRIIPLFEQQFELRLHPDDSVIVGYNEQDDWTVGKFFFQSTSVTSPRQHLLVLRLSEIETIEGRRSLQVHRGKY